MGLIKIYKLFWNVRTVVWSQRKKKFNFDGGLDTVFRDISGLNKVKWVNETIARIRMYSRSNLIQRIILINFEDGKRIGKADSFQD